MFGASWQSSRRSSVATNDDLVNMDAPLGVGVVPLTPRTTPVRFAEVCAHFVCGLNTASSDREPDFPNLCRECTGGPYEAYFARFREYGWVETTDWLRALP